MSWSIKAVGTKEELKAKLTTERVLKRTVQVEKTPAVIEGGIITEAAVVEPEEQEFDNEHLPDGLRAILAEAVDKIEGDRILLQASGHFDANTCQGSFIVQKV